MHTVARIRSGTDLDEDAPLLLLHQAYRKPMDLLLSSTVKMDFLLEGQTLSGQMVLIHSLPVL
jgi:hypothetical protein